MGSGQAAYHLSTHSARVPIQLTIDTSGWAIYIHQPLGIFDLSGDVGRFQTADTAKALPPDVFLISSDDPKTILAEYAKITGYPWDRWLVAGQGDGLDVPSRLARNRMYFEGTQMYRPNERVYALHRNGYAGMQRYAAFLWREFEKRHEAASRRVIKRIMAT
jgi:alpha-glucosidase (family GH31 glycosyl hydrolase)